MYTTRPLKKENNKETQPLMFSKVGIGHTSMVALNIDSTHASWQIHFSFPCSDSITVRVEIITETIAVTIAMTICQS